MYGKGPRGQRGLGWVRFNAHGRYEVVYAILLVGLEDTPCLEAIRATQNTCGHYARDGSIPNESVLRFGTIGL